MNKLGKEGISIVYNNVLNREFKVKIINNKWCLVSIKTQGIYEYDGLAFSSQKIVDGIRCVSWVGK